MPAYFDVSEMVSVAGGDAPNQDAVGASGSFAWVIDGATDLGPPGLLGARSPAAWLAARLNTYFHAYAGDADSIESLVRNALDCVRGAFLAERTREPVDRWELPFAAFLMVRATDGGLEAAWLGDCVGLLGGRAGATKRFGAPPDEAESEAIRATATPSREVALKQLRAARNRKNTEGGQWLLGVEPEAAQYLSRLDLPMEVGDAAVLLTDGLSSAIDRYGAQTPQTLIQAARQGLLHDVLRSTRAIENLVDPQCMKFPRYKRCDDASGISLLLQYAPEGSRRRQVAFPLRLTGEW